MPSAASHPAWQVSRTPLPTWPDWFSLLGVIPMKSPVPVQPGSESPSKSSIVVPGGGAVSPPGTYGWLPPAMRKLM